MNIVTIIGARPQFIKAATVSRAISKQKGINEILVHTGQHFDSNMSDVFFDELEIPKPNYNLGIGGGSHGEQTGLMLQEIEKVLMNEKPDWVLVYGDTNSTLAGALAASKIHIPVVHVEAGLRSFNMRMPEEQNRILTDHISSVLFAPTDIAIKNLEKEGIYNNVLNVGDVMFDAALFYGDLAERKSNVLKNIGVQTKSYVLATVHRAENTDDSNRLLMIFSQLNKIAIQEKVILPLHPRTKKALEREKYDFSKSSIFFIDPVGYLDMVALEKSAKMIVTDSGGVQKEAYFHNVPCMTLRDETEWLETVDAGCNHIISDLLSIFDRFQSLSKQQFDFSRKLYGTGRSATEIVEYLMK
ncbi:non-hydrolyzing UDP-N-acetylglucosamine 2-epimerase [Plebeiibacterium marinum]|uniref:UDP-N-acetylglucosamine 2-epimerase (Non-hydrolyzing) n=1 Tax=Plebeiibacterium marinum TaxID=2992111 RepID=A0AAE3MAB1_9BACT|nr:UDP-N-acetylglucosamine 2-epimerase (non-hydrolyzing) [Plebeiobacterium marinum]MCW3804161.1 UDP-N-acetylglucosamine 2-epimerase (non-hydrolyzing) [Plebeiobacterium marinum]